MKDRSYGLISIFTAMMFCFSIYVLLTIIAYNLYDDKIKLSIFDNFQEENDFKIIGIQVLFLVIFMAKIPYNFYIIKIYILNFI